MRPLQDTQNKFPRSIWGVSSFYKIQLARNNWKIKGIFSGLVTQRLYFLKKYDAKQPNFPSCRNWPICDNTELTYVPRRPCFSLCWKKWDIWVCYCGQEGWRIVVCYWEDQPTVPRGALHSSSLLHYQKDILHHWPQKQKISVFPFTEPFYLISMETGGDLQLRS